MTPNARGARITGIGSLPHHNIDAALTHSFAHDLPYLPQIPARNPWEFMLAQALEGLPGLAVDAEGAATLDLGRWSSGCFDFGRKLDAAFKSLEFNAFEPFEPVSGSCSAWKPFLFELNERGLTQAKIQVAGPMTAQWGLKIAGESSVLPPELQSQIYRLITARALAMARALRAQSIMPVFFLDEPGLFDVRSLEPRSLLGFQELKFLIQALAHEGATVGIHCCSDTDWPSLFALRSSGLGIVSVDAFLSLEKILEGPGAEACAGYLEEGGSLSLGIVPTGSSAHRNRIQGRNLHPADLAAFLKETLARVVTPRFSSVKAQLLEACLLTPACGLAFYSVSDAEYVLEVLTELKPLVQELGRSFK